MKNIPLPPVNKVKIKPNKLVTQFVSINKHTIGYVPVSMTEKNTIKVIMTIDE